MDDRQTRHRVGLSQSFAKQMTGRCDWTCRWYRTDRQTKILNDGRRVTVIATATTIMLITVGAITQCDS